MLEDVPLEKYNTLRLKSMAKLMIFPSNNQAIREICDKFDNKEFVVDSFSFKKSELTPKGAIYTDVGKYSLE